MGIICIYPHLYNVVVLAEALYAVETTVIRGMTKICDIQMYEKDFWIMNGTVHKEGCGFSGLLKSYMKTVTYGLNQEKMIEILRAFKRVRNVGNFTLLGCIFSWVLPMFLTFRSIVIVIISIISFKYSLYDFELWSTYLIVLSYYGLSITKTSLHLPASLTTQYFAVFIFCPLVIDVFYHTSFFSIYLRTP